MPDNGRERIACELDRAPADGDALDSFRFDTPDEVWLDRFRSADTPAPLGSIGPYDILAEIGRGGQGVVYKARQPGTGRVVAVKRLAAGAWASTRSRRRFDHEVRAVSSLRHPNIVTVFAMDVVDGVPVFAMEWIDGLPITRWAAGGDPAGEPATEPARRPPLSDRLACFVKVCDAVHHAHQHGLIHRDLKPANVLVDAAGEPHVLDFGLSHPVDAEVDATNMASMDDETGGSAARGAPFAGTLAFAAPEQVGAGDGMVDIRTDVHALGLLLYQLLAGRTPWPADGGAQQLADSIIRVVPPAPSTFASGIPGELDLIALKALAKDKRARYASVEALADDIRRHLSGDAVSAHPQTLVYAARKMARRHRAGAVVAVTVVALLAAFAVWSWRAAVEARLARDHAEEARAAALLARDDEREARDRAEQVSAFLNDTWSMALPSRGGAGATMLETLDRAARRLAEQPPVAPLVEADIRFAIGRTYNALWKWREAEPHLARGVDLLRKHSGPIADDSRAAARLSDWLTEHGRSYTSLHMPVAVDLHREALALRRRAFGEPSAPVAESLMRLGYALHQAADPPDWYAAEVHFEQALGMYRRLHAGPHRDTASCLHNYGWMRYRQQRYAEADGLYGQALSMLNALGDRRDPFRLELLHGYTSLKLLLGQHAESMALLEEAMPLVRAAYGESAVEPLNWRAALACQRLERLGDARRWYARAIAAACREAIDAITAQETGAANPPLDVAVLQKLDDIRRAATLAEQSSVMPPPFAALDDVHASLPPAIQARVDRYREHVRAFTQAAGE